MKLLAALVLALTGCAHTLSPAAATVRDATPESGVLTGCTRLPDVVGRGGWVGEAAVLRAKAEAREEAAKELATHIVWALAVPVPGIYSETVITAAAFKCPAATSAAP